MIMVNTKFDILLLPSVNKLFNLENLFYIRIILFLQVTKHNIYVRIHQTVTYGKKKKYYMKKKNQTRAYKILKKPTLALYSTVVQVWVKAHRASGFSTPNKTHTM